MNLKKFAAKAIMFTTATSLFMESTSMITSVPSTALAAGITLERSITNTDADDTDNSITEDADKSSTTSKEETKKKLIKTKPHKTKVKIQIARARARNNYSSSDVRLMSSIINCEAGMEPYQGKIAVGIVVMNRVKSNSFPNTIEGVIYQSGQFSPVKNGSLRKRLAQYDAGRTRSKQWKTCIRAAKKVLEGQRTIEYAGKTKNMSNYHFFSVGLRGARLSLGGHKFK